MAEPLIFLGAGASKPFGIPTMKDFVEDFSKDLDATGTPEEKSLYYAVSEDVQRRFGWIDLEAVFSVINTLSDGIVQSDFGYFSPFYYRRYLGCEPESTMNLSEKIETDKQTAKSLRGKLESFVRRKCDISEQYFGSIYSVYSSFFTSLADATGSRHTYRRNGKEFAYKTWSIFTTNYDLCIEEYCREYGLTLDTGVQYDQVRKQSVVSTESFNSGSDRLSLVKLHGSLNWFRQDDGRIIEHYREGERTFGLHKIVGQVMLYPIREKEMYLDPYLHMMYFLDRRLRLSRVWLVIGYRFNDEIIRGMFASHSNSKLMVIVHPNPKELREKLSIFNCERIMMPGHFGDPRTMQEIAQKFSDLGIRD